MLFKVLDIDIRAATWNWAKRAWKQLLTFEEVISCSRKIAQKREDNCTNSPFTELFKQQKDKKSSSNQEKKTHKLSFIKHDNFWKRHLESISHQISKVTLSGEKADQEQ